MMIKRRSYADVVRLIGNYPAVVLLGPRQVGKTTLALEIAATRPSVYLDLESEIDRERLQYPEEYLSSHEDKLVILDEVHRVPQLFQSLRGLIDRGRQQGIRNGRFLLLGSASIDLMRQSGESLAGRVAYRELSPVNVLEAQEYQLDDLWVRGGFPDSFLAASDDLSLEWRRNFIRTYLERDLPQLGPRIPAETLRRFWTMLAHSQGTLLNAANLARNLGVNGKTAVSYLDLLVDLLLVRRLQPWHANIGKRLVKSPKTYVRDSGLTHALLGQGTMEDLIAHPVVGGSWEGFVIENLLSVAPADVQAHFFRTTVGAEIDLLLTFPGGEQWAIEIKRSSAPKLDRGFHNARADLQPARSYVVYPGLERYPLSDGIEVISVRELMNFISQ